MSKTIDRKKAEALLAKIKVLIRMAEFKHSSEAEERYRGFWRALESGDNLGSGAWRGLKVELLHYCSAIKPKGKRQKEIKLELEELAK